MFRLDKCVSLAFKISGREHALAYSSPKDFVENLLYLKIVTNYAKVDFTTDALLLYWNKEVIVM